MERAHLWARGFQYTLQESKHCWKTRSSSRSLNIKAKLAILKQLVIINFTILTYETCTFQTVLRLIKLILYTFGIAKMRVSCSITVRLQPSTSFPFPPPTWKKQKYFGFLTRHEFSSSWYCIQCDSRLQPITNKESHSKRSQHVNKTSHAVSMFSKILGRTIDFLNFIWWMSYYS